MLRALADRTLVQHFIDISEALGRRPQADPAVVVEVLHRIWPSTLCGAPAPR